MQLSHDDSVVFASANGSRTARYGIFYSMFDISRDRNWIERAEQWDIGLRGGKAARLCSRSGLVTTARESRASSEQCERNVAMHGITCV